MLSNNRVLHDLWGKHFVMAAQTTWWGDFSERTNVIILGTFCAYSKAILVIQSHNGDLWEMNRLHCQKGRLFLIRLLEIILISSSKRAGHTRGFVDECPGNVTFLSHVQICEIYQLCRNLLTTTELAMSTEMGRENRPSVCTTTHILNKQTVIQSCWRALHCLPGVWNLDRGGRWFCAWSVSSV